MKKYIRLLIVFLIVGGLFIGTFLFCTRKDNIHNATIQEINTSSNLIGESKSLDIYLYVQANDIQRVSELEGKIPYVGKETIKDLEKKYK